MKNKGAKLSATQLCVLFWVLCVATAVLISCVAIALIQNDYKFLSGVIPSLWLYRICVGAVFNKKLN